MFRTPHFVGDTTIFIAFVVPPVAGDKGAAGWRSTRPTLGRGGIAGKGTTELAEKARNYAMKVDSIVKAAVGQVNEVATGNLLI